MRPPAVRYITFAPMPSFTKADLPDRPAHFSTYIDQTLDLGLLESLNRPLDADMEWAPYGAIAHKAYAPGKWTVAGVVQHMMDTERIFAYRALRIARGDTTALPGFDENTFGAASAGHGRPFPVMLEELHLLRRSTAAMFHSFHPDWLKRMGTCSGTAISAGALGFAILGHQRHHCGVLESRYRALAG